MPRPTPRLFFAALALLPGLLGTAAPTAADPSSDGDFLWRIESPANTVYLLGSIHALRREDYPLPTAYGAAYSQAEAVVVETRTTGDAGQQVRQALGDLKGGPPLEERLAPAQLRRARELAEELDYDLDRLGRLDPWLAGMVVMREELRKAGFDPRHGVDAFFQQRADADGKPVLTLESPAEQIHMLRQLPAGLQGDFLLRALQEAKALDQELSRLVTAWRAGDRKAVLRLVRDELKPFPDLRRRLVVERNRRWLPRIESFVGEERDYLVIVGAAHLLGEDGMLTLLRQRGYRVSP